MKLQQRLVCLFIILPTAAGCVIIEPLPFRTAVIAKQENSLRLADGGVLVLEGVASLNASTPLLDAACVRGVRLKGGRAVGQMKIWHWCGNDPVRYHIARVDLPHLVLFAGEGTPSEPIPLPERAPKPAALSQWGWAIGEYHRFQKWEDGG